MPIITLLREMPIDNNSRSWELTCRSCEEYREAAVRDNGLCHNCSSPHHTQGTCFACGLLAPTEHHHIIPQALKTGCRICVPLCLNCHAVVTRTFLTRVYINRQQKRQDNSEDAIQHALDDLFGMKQERRGYSHHTTQERRHGTTERNIA
jgi:hypothetical protein